LRHGDRLRYRKNHSIRSVEGAEAVELEIEMIVEAMMLEDIAPSEIHSEGPADLLRTEGGAPGGSRD
jgi:hypothetical protein